MARRTVTVVHLRYWRKHSRAADKAMDVSQLPGNGDLLTFAHARWLGLAPDELMEPEKYKFCRPVHERTLTAGRTFTAVANVGIFGEPASLRHAMTDIERVRHDGDLTHTVSVRVMLAVPLRATSALLYVEHAHEGSLGGAFLRTFSDRWQAHFPDYTLSTESLTRTDVWLKTAELQKVTAVKWGYSSDLADAGLPQKFGRVESVLRPDGSAFPRSLLDKLRRGEVNAQQLLGLTYDPSEVKVTLGDGEQQRTFVLDHERTPAVREVVTEHGTRPPTDEGFREWCLGRAPEHFQAVGVRWDARWNRGDWASGQPAVTA